MISDRNQVSQPLCVAYSTVWRIQYGFVIQ